MMLNVKSKDNLLDSPTPAGIGLGLGLKQQSSIMKPSPRQETLKKPQGGTNSQAPYLIDPL